jgi:hypothetical protein
MFFSVLKTYNKKPLYTFQGILNKITVQRCSGYFVSDREIGDLDSCVLSMGSDNVV